MIAVDPDFYFETLYPFQDRVLQAITDLDTGFYLSGGTAASRGYLHHRFSDDLDLFVDDEPRFALWAARIIQTLSHHAAWQCEVLLQEERFVRLVIVEAGVLLKIECINDVPARVGLVRSHPLLGHLDSPENILANKITALIDREEPKDFADIWGFCCQMQLSLLDAITGAQGKAAGIFPVDLARLLLSATPADWAAVRWIAPPPVAQFLSDLQRLGERLILL